MSNCASRFGFSQRCQLVAGHEGRHESAHMTWTDNEAATSQQSITNQLGGKTE